MVPHNPFSLFRMYLRMFVRYIHMSCILQHLEVWNFSVAAAMKAAVMKPGTIEHKTLRRLGTEGLALYGRLHANGHMRYISYCSVCS